MSRKCRDCDQCDCTCGEPCDEKCSCQRSAATMSDERATCWYCPEDKYTEIDGGTAVCVEHFDNWLETNDERP